VRLWPYALASWLGMLPGTVVYVSAGAFARAGVTDAGWTAGRWALSGVGLAATVAATIFITRIARRALILRGASAFKG
jgi:uncharacterized membrane protein YdjX (TVP38/TMEM64 family)